jgi:hypothetical protein
LSISESESPASGPDACPSVKVKALHQVHWDGRPSVKVKALHQVHWDG